LHFYALRKTAQDYLRKKRLAPSIKRKVLRCAASKATLITHFFKFQSWGKFKNAFRPPIGENNARNNVKLRGGIFPNSQMKGLDTYVNCFLNGTEEDGPDIKYIFSVINLCENSELQAYDDSFSNAKIAVAETVSSVVKGADKVGKDHIKDTANVTDDSCSLIDIRDDWAIDNYPLPFVALQMQECILHYSKSLSLHCGCSKRHYYFIQDDVGAKLKSLTLTVVYHGWP
jgi:hypothetical protein